jgi:spore coat protein U-like protein
MNIGKQLATVAAIFLGAFACCIDAQAAGNMSGTLGATMVLTAGCAVSGASGGNAAVNFGMLEFGTQPSTFTGVLVANPTGGAQGGGATQISCSPDVAALSVSVSGGNNPGQGANVGTGTRALKLGSSYLPYEVYSDAAMVSAFPTAATPLGVVMPGTGAPISLPVFGRINKTNATAMPAGSYVDVLQVTLSW